MHLEHGRVQKQVVQVEVIQPPLAPRRQLLAMARHTDETVDLLNAASAPRASASVASTSRVDNPRTNPAITSDSNAFDRVMPLPNSREQNCSVVPRSFGR